METHADEVTLSVVETASDALEKPIEELPPLSEEIDVDALNEIIPSAPTDQPPYVTVTFSYAGLSVGVRAGNTVSVSPIRKEGKEPADRTHFKNG